MADLDYEKLLGGYATGTLTDAERQVLFEAALQDQRLFNALADDEALKALLDDPVSRQRLIQALEAADQPETKAWRWGALVPAWLAPPSAGLPADAQPEVVCATVPSRFELPARRRSWKGALGAGLIFAALAVIVAAGLIEELISPPLPVLVAEKGPALGEEPSGVRSAEIAKEPEPVVPPSSVLPPEQAAPPAREQPAEPVKQRPPSAARAPRTSRAAKAQPDQAPARPEAQPEVPSQPAPSPESPAALQAPALPGVPAQEAMQLRVAAPALSARSLFYASTGSVEGERPLGLRYGLIRKSSAGSEQEVVPGLLVNPDDEVRLHVEVNTTGYLYVLKRTPPETWTIVYPNLGSTTDPGGRAAYVHSGTRYIVPSGGSLTTPEDRGPLQFVLVFSKRPLSQFGTFGLGSQHANVPSPAVAELIQQIRTEIAGGKLLSEHPEAEGQTESAVYLVDRSAVPRSRILADMIVSVR
jgi:hypothetical protein